MEAAHSPGFPVHEHDCWGTCDQLNNLRRPGDVHLPLVVPKEGPVKEIMVGCAVPKGILISCRLGCP